MPSTYTPSDQIQQIGIGEQNNTWGNSVNTNMALIDQALDGVQFVNLTGTTYNLNIAAGTLSNGRNRVIIFTGSPGSTVAVSITPINIQKNYLVNNRTGQPITFTNGTGTSVTVPSGYTGCLICDGTGNVTSGNTVPSLLPGSDVVSSVSTYNLTTSGATGIYFIFKFGNVAGVSFGLAIGVGTAVNGATINVPPSFTPFQQIVQAWPAQASVASGADPLYNINVQVFGINNIIATASDNAGHSSGITVGWISVAYVAGLV